MQSVDGRGHGPDRKAKQKRMRDVDVANVMFGAKRRVKQVAWVAVLLVGSGPAQFHKLVISSLRSVLEPAT